VAFHSSEALILDVRDLQDADRVVTFLAREAGKKRGAARGARRPHSRFAGQLQPLAKARVAWFEKEGRELVRISGVDLLRPAARLQADLDGILLGSYLVDHMLEFAQEHEPNDLLYRLLDSTVEALLAGVDRDLAARYFEVWVLRLSGIFPPPVECPACGRAYPAAGAVVAPGGEGLVCADCAGVATDAPGSLAVGPDALAFLRRIGGQSLAAAAREPPAPPTLRLVEQLAARVRRHFLQHELRSYEVIRRTLAGA
jgi:DNA repair protein RecO (recombination protein O)